MGDNAVQRSSTAGEKQLSHGKITFLEAGDGRPVLFLHGINGGARSWTPQLQTLSGDLRVIAWDAPGYGGSDVVPPTITEFANAGLELIDALGGRPMAVVGHSLGGAIAMKMISLRPDLISRAVFSCTHPGHARSVDEQPARRYSRRAEEYATLPRAEYGYRRARGMLPQGTPDNVFNAIAEIAASVRLEGMQAASRAMDTADLRPDLPGLDIPALVVTCECDKVVASTQSSLLLQLLPNRQHVLLPHLGHAPYYEDPAAFNAAILPFLLAEHGEDASLSNA